MDVKAVTTNFFFEGVFSPVPSFLSFFLHFSPSLTPPFSHPEVAPLAKGFGGVLVSWGPAANAILMYLEPRERVWWLQIPSYFF